MKRILKAGVCAIIAACLLTAGCSTLNGSGVPNYVVHHPDENVAATTLHTEASAQLNVPNAEHRRMDVSIIQINGEPIQSSHPVVLPAGVHNLTFRCELKSKSNDATENRIFYGQSQWKLEANKTYTIVPSFEIDDYNNPICTASLASKL